MSEKFTLLVMGLLLLTLGGCSVRGVQIKSPEEIAAIDTVEEAEQILEETREIEERERNEADDWENYRYNLWDRIDEIEPGTIFPIGNDSVSAVDAPVVDSGISAPYAAGTGLVILAAGDRYLAWEYVPGDLDVDPADPDDDVVRFEVWGFNDPTLPAGDPNRVEQWLDAGLNVLPNVTPVTPGNTVYGFLLPVDKTYRFVRAMNAAGVPSDQASIAKPAPPSQPRFYVEP